VGVWRGFLLNLPQPPRDTDRSHSMHHPLDPTPGSAVIAGVTRELINLAISCLSLNAESAVCLSGPPHRAWMHPRGSPSRQREMFILRYSYGQHPDIEQ